MSRRPRPRWDLRRGLRLLATDNPDSALGRNLVLNVYQGVLSVMSANLVGPFLGIFAVRAGASNVQVGLLSSLPALMGLIAMVPGARLLDGHRDQKRLTCAFLLAHRAFYLLLAALPFFRPERQAALLVGAVALMNLPAAVGNVGWQALISRIIPSHRRATAFAARSRLMNLVGTVTVLLAGRSIDILGHPVGYQVMFVLAFVFALGEISVLNRLDDTVASDQAALVAQVGTGVGRVSPEVKSRFWRYTLVSMLFYLAWQVPWPVMTLYQVRELGANNTWISLLNLANTGGALLGFGFWARMADRRGHLWTLSYSSSGIFLVPIIYAFSRDLPTLVAFNLLTGTVFSGVTLSLFNVLLEVTPEEHKATYIAYYTTGVNISSVAAPVLGVTLLGRLGFTTTFLLCAVSRLLGSLLYHGLRWLEAGEVRRWQRDRAARA